MSGAQRRRKSPSVSFSFTTTVDVDWTNRELLNRCKAEMDLQDDGQTVETLLTRVFGPGAVREASMIGAKEFGGGTNYQKSVLVAFEGDTPTSISFSLHSTTPYFRKRHADDLANLLERIRGETPGGSKVKWSVSVDIDGYPLERTGWKAALRAYLWVIATGFLAAVPFVVLKDFRTVAVTAVVAVLIYIISALIAARRGSYVLEIR